MTKLKVDSTRDSTLEDSLAGQKRLKLAMQDLKKNKGPTCIEFSQQLTEKEDADAFESKVDAFFAQEAQLKPTSPVKDIGDVLSDNFIVGETHDQTSTKKFLMDNMNALKESGYTTLFMEHLFYEHQQELDDYIFNADAVLDPKLKKCIA